ncbi:MAG TPA: 2OG-Fe(II) oxygenase [Brevundimonas sp.]|nr:2OG-Fe(II) oxygenase [Brevundimonas sp.]
MREVGAPRKRGSGGAVAQSDPHETGIGLLLGIDGDPEPEQAAAYLAAAVQAGSGAAAARLAVLAGLGLGRTQSWSDCLDLLETGARLGDRPAQRQLGVLTDDPALAVRIRSSGVGGPAVWRRARQAIDMTAWTRLPPSRALCAAPRIRAIDGFLSSEVCRWLIHRGDGQLEAAMINDPVTGDARPDPMRTNTVNRFGLARIDVVMLLIQARIAAATGFPMVHMEAPNILSYAPGQEYRPHYDFFNPASPQFNSEIDQLGQRVATFLVYLSEDFSGGETDFPRAGQRHRGRTGDALVFMNVREDGSPDVESLHAGLPPTRGRKWLLSQWIRARPQAIS